MEHPQPELLNPEVDYERSTISIPLVVWFVIGFIVFGILTAIGMRITWKWMSQHETQKSVVTSTVMTNTVITPTPRLQPSPGNDSTPWQDLQKMRQSEYAAFKQRGWIEEKSGNIVIPDTIIQQVAQLSATTTSPSTPVGATPASRSSVPPSIVTPSVAHPPTTNKTGGAP
jgi:hypothetical protein